MPQLNLVVDFDETPAATPNRARIDGRRYTSPEVMAKEWAQVWRKTWLFAGLEQDVAEPGDFFVFDLGRESILVARTEAGSLSAVYNVCQHRGNKLTALAFGSVGALTCPYHGWTYALDGTLKTVPDLERFPQGVDCKAKSLKPVKVESWAGGVWINMDPDAMPLAQFLGALVGELAPYRLERMQLTLDQTVAIDANWKTAIDNFSELYHVDFLHAQHASFVNCRDARVELMPYGHTSVWVAGYVTNPRYPEPQTPPPILQAAMTAIGLDPADFEGRVPEVRAAAQRRKRELGPELGFDYTGLTDEQVSDVWQYNIFPNLIMTVRPEQVWLMRVRPHPQDPNKCLFDKLTLDMPLGEAGAGLHITSGPRNSTSAETPRPEHEVFTQEDVIAGRQTLTATIDQDIFYLRDMQAGLHSAGFDAAHLSEDESRVQHFHDWLDLYLNGRALPA